MSLATLAAQICAVQALKGKTLVGDSVRDSEAGVINIDKDGNLATTEAKPFITVWSDDFNAIGDGATLYEPGRLELNFEFGLTSSMPLVTPEGKFLVDAETNEVISAEKQTPLDAHLNVMLLSLEYQIKAALSADTLWGNLYRRFMQKPYSYARKRGGNTGSGIRFAGCQLKIEGNVLADPVIGDGIRETSAWGLLFSALKDNGLGNVCDAFEATLKANADPNAVTDIVARYSLSGSGKDKLGEGHYFADREDIVFSNETAVIDLSEKS